jgi:hypothetical protein
MLFGDLLVRNGGTHFHVGDAGSIGAPDRGALGETLEGLVEEPVGKDYVESPKCQGSCGNHPSSQFNIAKKSGVRRSRSLSSFYCLSQLLHLSVPPLNILTG